MTTYQILIWHKNGNCQVSGQQGASQKSSKMGQDEWSSNKVCHDICRLYTGNVHGIYQMPDQVYSYAQRLKLSISHI